MQSATTLVIKQSIKRGIYLLKIYIYIGVVFYVSFGITLIVIKEIKDKYLLTCKSQEFII